jgi:tRNA pseudouridine32 synthase / 23S rRNA pseudouridine746 synthase
VTDAIPILYEDGSLVAVDKPAGRAVIPAAGEAHSDSVRGRLEAQLGTSLWVVHRLDRDTSGVLLFARTADAHRSLCLAFEQRRVRKTYSAFTLGVPSTREGRIDTPLHAARRGKVRPAAPHEPGSIEAATRYSVRKCWVRADARVALLDVHPETGRHHQIRAHLRSVGMPILFDPLYGRLPGGDPLAGAPAQRLALHASRLIIPEPAAPGGARTIDAPLPADLVALLRWLDGGWTAVTSWPGRSAPAAAASRARRLR